MHESGHEASRLLVVDDNKVNRLLLTRNLEQQGTQGRLRGKRPRRAGDAAPRRLSTSLLLDMEMPEMDGFQVLEQLKSDLQLRDLPVIVTSSLEGIDNVVRCIELGAEDYLTKPVNPVLLKARIGASLEKKRLRDQQKVLCTVRGARGRKGSAELGVRAWREARSGLGDVLRHPRLHRAR